MKNLTFTKTGLIKKGKGYARNWQEVFELAGKTTARQQSMFKTKYADQIKMVEFETVNAHGEVRKNVYMVASQKIAGNKDMSDYQKKAFSTPETTVRTNKERFANRVTSVMKLALLGLEESLSYNFNCVLIDGDVVDMETGEIVYAKERLFKLISDIAKNVNDADEIILGVVSTLYVDLGKKVVFVKEDENGDRVVVTIDRESLVSGSVKVVKIEKEEDQTIITIKEKNEEEIKMAKKTGIMEIGFTNGVVVADAKTGMVDLKSLEIVGNLYNGVTDVSQRGYKRLNDWYRLQATQEFIGLCEEKNSITGIPSIKIGRGRYAKSMANIHIAIDFAMWLNPEFKYEIIDTFVNKKILDVRLLGLDSFKKLNDKVKEMLGEKAGSYHFVKVAESVNKKVKGEFIKGWDNVDSDADAQRQRARIIDMACVMIDMGMVNNFEGLINFIDNFKG